MNKLVNAFSWLNGDVADNRDDTEILRVTESVNGKGKAKEKDDTSVEAMTLKHENGVQKSDLVPGEYKLPLVWIDLEMTGLNIEVDKILEILEIACVITDGNLTKSIEHLKKKKQKHLYQALQKVKEELMLLGFISLMLTVFQGRIVKFCVPHRVVTHLLPCSYSLEANSSSTNETTHPASPANPSSTNETTHHASQAYSSPTNETTHHASHHHHSAHHHHRHLLAEEEGAGAGYCSAKHKVPLLSLEALHHLHIFIFVLAIVHVTFSVLTIVFGGIKIRQWKHWEDAIVKDNYDSEHDFKPAVTHVHEHDFIRNRFQGIGKQSAILGWVHSFFKQFYASVNKSDYRALRLGFIMTHCRGNPRFNFHQYMIRALEDDFKTVVGISWYLWIFVILFLLLNINGWHTYFWIAFVPFILLLAVGTKLEHVIIQLAHEIAEKHVAVEGELVVQPSDAHFWFDRPQIVLLLIHFILFQNAFEIAFFFWILVQYGFFSCIMGKYVYVIPRLVIGVFIQVLCSYSTLPLYALVTQMGSHYKKSMFDDHVQACLIEWAEKVKKKKAMQTRAAKDSSSHSTEGSTIGSPMSGKACKESTPIMMYGDA